MLKGRVETPLEGLCVECARLRKRLSEAEQALTAFHRGIEQAPPNNRDSLSLRAPLDSVEHAYRQLTGDIRQGREGHETDLLDRALERARAEAKSLLDIAIAAHARAEANNEELQREIQRRKHAEAALQRIEQRSRKRTEAIGNPHSLSAAEAENARLNDPSP
jgi:hypothetical protein